MKRSMLLTLVMLCVLSSTTSAQDITFEVHLDKDTIRTGETIMLEFKLNNAEGVFDAPEIEGLTIVGGPNYSSQFSMINGQTNMATSYSYYLRGEEEGEYFIGPASVKTKDEILETQPVKIVVIHDPNYQKPSPQIIPSTIKKRKKAIRI